MKYNSDKLLCDPEKDAVTKKRREQLWHEIYRLTSVIPESSDLTQELIDERRKSAIVESKNY